MTSRVNRGQERERREKKQYNGRPVPEGYVLAPVWLKRDFVNDAADILSENLTTRTYAGIRFLIGYVAVPPEEYEGLKQACDAEINAHLKSRRSGRCVIGLREDGSPRLCPKSRRCTGCPHKGEYERYNPWKDGQKKVPLEDAAESLWSSDRYPGLEDAESDEELLARLLRHLASIDPRYSDIVTMKLAGVSMEEIFAALHVKSSRGYQVVKECEQECREYFGVKGGKKR